MDPVKALKQVAFHLERAGEPTYRVQAFRNAAAVLADLDAPLAADLAARRGGAGDGATPLAAGADVPDVPDDVEGEFSRLPCVVVMRRLRA